MKDKIVVITGASSGIGKALAEVFASKGSKLVLAARNIEKLEELRSALASKGAAVLTVACDVSKEDDCRKLIDEAVAGFGTIHVLINNAGISMRALFADLDLDVLRQLMNTNFWGAV